MLPVWSRKRWIVYAKEPFAGPQQVLEYLGRYTHKVAISDYRILALEDGQVTFRYRDRKAGDIEKQMTLSAGGLHPPVPPAHSAARPSEDPLLRLDGP